MKRFYILCIFQVMMVGCLCAQNKVKNEAADVSFQSAFKRTNPLFGKEPLSSVDSISFKKFCDSIHKNRFNPFFQQERFQYWDKNKISDALDFHYKILPKQKYFFAIHDYSAGWNLSRVSRMDNPFFDHPRDNHYLWSGYLQPYRETGFPKNFFDMNYDNPPIIIYIIRDKAKVRGYGIERLAP